MVPFRLVDCFRVRGEGLYLYLASEGVELPNVSVCLLGMADNVLSHPNPFGSGSFFDVVGLSNGELFPCRFYRVVGSGQDLLGHDCVALIQDDLTYDLAIMLKSWCEDNMVQEFLSRTGGERFYGIGVPLVEESSGDQFDL